MKIYIIVKSINEPCDNYSIYGAYTDRNKAEIVFEEQKKIHDGDEYSYWDLIEKELE